MRISHRIAPIGCTLSLLLIAGGCADAPSPTEGPTITDKTDFRAMAPDGAMALLRNARNIRVSRGSGPDFKACNGKDTIETSREFACFQTGDDTRSTMEALFRGCGVYALDQTQALGGKTCGALGEKFWDMGNQAAAIAIWGQAPGCHSFNGDGGANGCFSSIENHFLIAPHAGFRRIDTPELRKWAQMGVDACNQNHDFGACEYVDGALHELGPDMSAALHQRETEVMNRFTAGVRAGEEARNDPQPESDPRDAIIAALQSMPGAQNPNAIVDAANQQGAAIRAIGDANAARAAQLRANTQLNTLGNQTDALPARPPNSGGFGNFGTLAANGGAIATSSSPTAAAPAASYLNPLPASCVRQFWDPKYYNWLSLEDDCGQAIHLTIMPRHAVGWAMSGGMDLAPGAHDNTGQSSDSIQQAGGFELYVCPAGSIPVDTNGNPFNAIVPQFRCKRQ